MEFINSAFFVLVLATIGLAIYRKVVSAHEEDVLHLGAGEERLIPGQVALARRLALIDKYGKILTVLTLVVGLVIAGLYSYRAWLDPSSVPNTFFFRPLQ